MNTAAPTSPDLRFTLQLASMFVVLTLLSLFTSLNAAWIYTLVILAASVILISLLTERKFWLASVTALAFIVTIVLTARSVF